MDGGCYGIWWIVAYGEGKAAGCCGPVCALAIRKRNEQGIAGHRQMR